MENDMKVKPKMVSKIMIVKGIDRVLRLLMSYICLQLPIKYEMEKGINDIQVERQQINNSETKEIIP